MKSLVEAVLLHVSAMDLRDVRLLGHTSHLAKGTSEEVADDNVEATQARATILTRSSTIFLDELSQLPDVLTVTSDGMPIDICVRIKECDGKFAITLGDPPEVSVLRSSWRKLMIMPFKVCIACALVVTIMCHHLWVGWHHLWVGWHHLWVGWSGGSVGPGQIMQHLDNSKTKNDKNTIMARQSKRQY